MRINQILELNIKDLGLREGAAKARSSAAREDEEEDE